MKKKWLWAGVDLGVETGSVCILNDAGDILHEGTCQSSAKHVRHELTRFRRTRFATIAFEAGTGMHVARGLDALGYPVAIYESRQLSKFLRVRRNKTDAGDAKGIAEAARISASLVSKVYLKSFDSQALQARLAIRRHLVRQRVAASNMLGRQIELFGGRLAARPLSRDLQTLVDHQMHHLLPARSAALRTQLRYLAEHCDRLVAYQRTLDLELKHAAQDNEVCRRLMEIPGVGPLCALTFFAAVDDPHRFSRSSAIGSYFGMAPRLHQSGLTSRKSRISKMGNKSVRTLLVRAAQMHMCHCDPDSRLHAWTAAIEKRRGRRASRMALARKLAVIMVAMWKSGGHFDQHHGSPSFA